MIMTDLPDSELQGGSIAIIPARGGSKSIRRKNIREVGGAPLVVRTIRAARRSRCFSTVAVSSDDDEILETARVEGAHPVRRPAHLASDHASTEPVMEHCLNQVEDQLGREFGWLWLLQPTSPFLSAEHIREAAAMVGTGEWDSIVSVCSDHGFLWGPAEAVSALEIVPEYELSRRPRRQDAPPRYRENGALYAISRDMWEAERVRAGGRTGALVMPRWRSIEIDEIDDLRVADCIARDVFSTDEGIRTSLGSIQAVALDFDGVLTDNRVMIDSNGIESVWCSRADGWGIGRLRSMGVEVAVFSTEENPVVVHRCEKLGVPCKQHLTDKVTALREWLEQIRVNPAHCAFVGNDENDLPALEFAGLAVVPADAHCTARRSADLVLARSGGDHAVRELAGLILEARETTKGGGLSRDG